MLKYDCGVYVLGFFPIETMGNVPSIIGFKGGCCNDRLKIINVYTEAGCIPMIDSGGRWLVQNIFIGGTHAVQTSYRTGQLIPPDSTYGYKLLNKRGFYE